MHANFQELLSLRDGESVSSDLERHVSDCIQCGRELSRLQRLRHELLQLPQFEPGRHTWNSIREQLKSQTKHTTSNARIYLAAAGLATAMLALSVLWAVSHVSTVSRSTSADTDLIEPLVTRSQQLEAILEQLPQRPSVRRAATAATIDELQSRIQWLDLQLSNLSKDAPDSEQTQRLWNTRVQLLDSLVHVRYAEAARDGYQPMSSLESGVI